MRCSQSQNIRLRSTMTLTSTLLASTSSAFTGSGAGSASSSTFRIAKSVIRVEEFRGKLMVAADQAADKVEESEGIGLDASLGGETASGPSSRLSSTVGDPAVDLFLVRKFVRFLANSAFRVIDLVCRLLVALSTSKFVGSGSGSNSSTPSWSPGKSSWATHTTYCGLTTRLRMSFTMSKMT